MPRPHKCRKVLKAPVCTCFKPGNVPMRALQRVLLTLDQYEAIRLADYEGLEHAEAALKMGISRPTFTRLITSAHKVLAKVLVEGHALVIDGGSVTYSSAACPRCGADCSACRCPDRATCNTCIKKNAGE